MRKNLKKKHLPLYALAILAIAAGLYVWLGDEAEPNSKAVKKTAAAITPAPVPAAAKNSYAGFNKQQYSTTDPASIWVVVNKKHPLPSGYVPADLTVPNVPLNLSAQSQQMQVSGQMAPFLEKLVAGAQNSGINLKLNSGYRSEALQKQLFDSYAARDGAAAAATYSAYPGTSEHQTGLAGDLMAASGTCTLEICFANTPEGMWLSAHAHEYGFIIRYLQGKETITTYQYEPWHVRYVGNELAAQLHSSGLSMEEFFGYN